MVIFSYYTSDPRPRREAEALTAEGWSVDVICLAQLGEPLEKEIRHVSIKGIPLHREDVHGKLRYVRDYAYFIGAAGCRLLGLHLQNPYDVIHVHNMPDILILSALLPKFLGAKVILDLHDPMPELFRAIYGLRQTHPLVRLLIFMEKLSIRLADHVFTPNIAFRNLFLSRGCPPAKIAILMNSPQEDLFGYKATDFWDYPISFAGKPFRLLFHGLVAERSGVDLAVRAMACLHDRIPDLELEIYGRGPAVPDVKRQVAMAGLEDAIRFYDPVAVGKVPGLIAQAHLGIIPNRPNVFTQLNLPTRILECLCMGRLVVAPRTRGIRDYFAEDELIFFDPGNWRDLAEKIFAVYQNPSRFKPLLNRALKVCRHLRWANQKQTLTEAYSRITAGGRRDS